LKKIVEEKPPKPKKRKPRLVIVRKCFLSTAERERQKIKSNQSKFFVNRIKVHYFVRRTSTLPMIFLLSYIKFMSGVAKRFFFNAKTPINLRSFYEFLNKNREDTAFMLRNLMYCLYIKRKSGCSILTLTNGQGEVIRSFSTGMLSRKVKQGKKLRKSFFTYNELMEFFVGWFVDYYIDKHIIPLNLPDDKVIFRAKIDYVFVESARQAKSTARYIRRLFKRASIRVRFLKLLLRIPHSESLKTKKIRRL
jgi:hypothetical protein